MKNKWVNGIILILFLMFLGLYFSSNSGLIDYQSRHKKMLTEEGIKKFEEDLENNENIDIKDYIEYDDNKYDNKISKSTLKLSNFIGNRVKDLLNFTFGNLERALNK